MPMTHLRLAREHVAQASHLLAELACAPEAASVRAYLARIAGALDAAETYFDMAAMEADTTITTTTTPDAPVVGSTVHATSAMIH